MIGYLLGFATGIAIYKFLYPFILSWRASQLEGLPQDIDLTVWEEAETVHNATVQIIRNTKTGEYSFGWWRN